jgi:hypothetical protein
MPHGSTKGIVDSRFKDRIKELQDVAKKSADVFKTGTGFRPWHVPKDLDGKDLMFVPHLHEGAWNRDEINRVYSQQVLGGMGDGSGTVGDLMAMKWQADFMAMEERAFRLRHASMVRCASMAHGRMKGHGLSQGGVFDIIESSVKSFIDAGS